MSQSYMQPSHRTETSRAVHAQPRAVAAFQRTATISELAPARKAHSKPRTALVGLARIMDRPRFTYALWSCVLLFVAGCALLYRAPAVDGELWFLLGGACVIGAAALFRLSRAGLIARFESESRQQGLSEGAAHMRAHELFDQMLVSTQKYAPLPPESGDANERVLEKLPLA